MKNATAAEKVWVGIELKPGLIVAFPCLVEQTAPVTYLHKAGGQKKTNLKVNWSVKSTVFNPALN